MLDSIANTVANFLRKFLIWPHKAFKLLAKHAIALLGPSGRLMQGIRLLAAHRLCLISIFQQFNFFERLDVIGLKSK